MMQYRAGQCSGERARAEAAESSLAAAQAEIERLTKLLRQADATLRLHGAGIDAIGASQKVAVEFARREREALATVATLTARVEELEAELQSYKFPADGSCVRCGCVPRNASGLCATCVDEDAERAGEVGLIDQFSDPREIARALLQKDNHNG